MLIMLFCFPVTITRHDYFTSCLPWPQKGPGVELPIGTVADINFPADAVIGTQPSGYTPTFRRVSTTGSIWSTAVNLVVPNASTAAGPLGIDPSGINRIEWVNPNLSLAGIKGVTADLSTATAITINSLRQAFQVQKLLERDARGGTRYTEILRSHFGVVSPDARLCNYLLTQDKYLFVPKNHFLACLLVS